MEPLKRQAHYYETDKMGIIHHSNYIRWFEEARTSFLNEAGFGYKEMENQGILIPVLSISCEYKSPVRFGDTVYIYTELTAFDGLKFTVNYHVIDAETLTLKVVGSSKHCFLNKDFQPVRLKRNYPAIYELFNRLLTQPDNDPTP
ncbi:MAG: acyl-CoA thioesterase [Lachnospiraceae bacterium]